MFYPCETTQGFYGFGWFIDNSQGPEVGKYCLLEKYTKNVARSAGPFTAVIFFFF